MASAQLHSMTGFGNAHAKDTPHTLTCEVRTLNFKGLDIRVRLPKELSALEIELMALAKNYFSRGRVDIHLQLSFGYFSQLFTFNQEAAHRVVQDLYALLPKYPSLNPEIRLGDLLFLDKLFSTEESSHLTASFHKKILSLAQKALRQAKASRLKEGSSLKTSLLLLKKEALALLSAFKETNTKRIPHYFDELKKRSYQLLEGRLIDENRLLQELALLVDKTDITEELVRLEAHFNHFQSLLTQTASSGRKLDFLCQELLREANTIGSKCHEFQTQHWVVELKACIEKIREIVQNIE